MQDLTGGEGERGVGPWEGGMASAYSSNIMLTRVAPLSDQSIAIRPGPGALMDSAPVVLFVTATTINIDWRTARPLTMSVELPALTGGGGLWLGGPLIGREGITGMRGVIKSNQSDRCC